MDILYIYIHICNFILQKTGLNSNDCLSVFSAVFQVYDCKPFICLCRLLLSLSGMYVNDVSEFKNNPGNCLMYETLLICM